jgi:hypothetical protein
MIICVKIIKIKTITKKKKVFIRKTDGQTDRQTHVQLKTMVRNLTIKMKSKVIIKKSD